MMINISLKKECISSKPSILNLKDYPSYKTYKTCVLNEYKSEINSTKIQQTCCKCYGCYIMPFKTIWLTELIISANS